MLFIDGIVFSLQKSGGISVYFSEIVKRLDCFYSDDFVFSCRYNNNLTLRDYNLHSKPIINRSVLPLSVDRFLDVTIPKDTEVFHSSYYRLPKKNNAGVKVITTVHDFTYERFKHGLSAKVHHLQKKKSLLRSDVIICISESTKRDLLHFIPECKDKDVRVIYNGVSDDFHPINKNVMHNKKYVIFVGARAGYKNFLSLVHAIAPLDDINLVIVGGGDLTQDEFTVLSNILPNRFEFKGFISNYDLNLLYNHAFCLVYPSLYEGFGIPVLEAMKSGCPVIASNTSSLPEISKNAAILIDNISPTSIKHSIESLSETALRCNLIDKGLRNAARFSWDKTFDNLKEIYFG